jgi:hypothetical protein
MALNPQSPSILIAGYHRAEMALADRAHRYALAREGMTSRLLGLGRRCFEIAERGI